MFGAGAEMEYRAVVATIQRLLDWSPRIQCLAMDSFSKLIRATRQRRDLSSAEVSVDKVS